KGYASKTIAVMRSCIAQIAKIRDNRSVSDDFMAKRSKKSKDAVFIDSSGLPLVDKDFSSITLSFLDKAGVDTNVYKAHSTRAAMASWLLLNGISLHRVKKLGRWRSNAALEKYYDMEIIDQDSKRSKDFVSNSLTTRLAIDTAATRLGCAAQP
ncbi:hypothetical protein DFA_02709, partial [Cavenderia fasciculata]